MATNITGMSSSDIREVKRKMARDLKNQIFFANQEIRELNIAAAQEGEREQLLKDPNYVAQKISWQEFSKVLRLIVEKDYHPNDAWLEMALDEKRHPEWMKKVRKKSCHYDEGDMLNLQQSHGIAVNLMKEYGTFDARLFAAASTYNSTANKIYKALVEAKKKEKNIQGMKHKIEDLKLQVSDKNILLSQVNNQLQEKEVKIMELETHNKELTTGILTADDYSPMEQARRLWLKGMSRKDIAVKLGKTVRTISRYTKGLAKGMVAT